MLPEFVVIDAADAAELFVDPGRAIV